MIDEAKLAVLTDEELARQPFDELVAALQRTVQALEAGTVGLEESIELYRQGLRLHAACETRLREAEGDDHRARAPRRTAVTDAREDDE